MPWGKNQEKNRKAIEDEGKNIDLLQKKLKSV